MLKQNLNYSSGYIALMSTIVISVLLLAMAVSLGFAGFFGRFNVLDSESKERSLGLAEACADIAILNFAENISYGGNETIYLDPDNPLEKCTIFSLEDHPTENWKIIKTQASFNNSFTNIKVTVDKNSVDIISWEELTNL